MIWKRGRWRWQFRGCWLIEEIRSFFWWSSHIALTKIKRTSSGFFRWGCCRSQMNSIVIRWMDVWMFATTFLIESRDFSVIKLTTAATSMVNIRVERNRRKWLILICNCLTMCNIYSKSCILQARYDLGKSKYLLLLDRMIIARQNDSWLSPVFMGSNAVSFPDKFMYHSGWCRSSQCQRMTKR